MTQTFLENRLFEPALRRGGALAGLALSAAVRHDPYKSVQSRAALTLTGSEVLLVGYAPGADFDDPAGFFTRLQLEVKRGRVPLERGQITAVGEHSLGGYSVLRLTPAQGLAFDPDHAVLLLDLTPNTLPGIRWHLRQARALLSDVERLGIEIPNLELIKRDAHHIHSRSNAQERPPAPENQAGPTLIGGAVFGRAGSAQVPSAVLRGLNLTPSFENQVLVRLHLEQARILEALYQNDSVQITLFDTPILEKTCLELHMSRTLPGLASLEKFLGDDYPPLCELLELLHLEAQTKIQLEPTVKTWETELPRNVVARAEGLH